MHEAVQHPAPLPPPADGQPPGPAWRSRAGHHGFLEEELRRLLSFASDPRHPAGGFGWLDGVGRVDTTQPVHTWISARMTHVHALALLHGRPGHAALVDHGVAALTGPLRASNGWVDALPVRGEPAPRHQAYTHAFVVLAAASATAAGRPGGEALLDDALRVLEERFLDGHGRVIDARDAQDRPEPYRGANASMHVVEATMAAADVLGDPAWHEVALTIATHLIDEVTRAHGWRLIEHFDSRWEPALEHHRDLPDHPFQPYGTTIGHWFEWARLLLQLEASLTDPPSWLLEASHALLHAGLTVGWATDGAPGFVYTLDWQDQPVVRNRLHWVVTEAIAATAVYHERTGDPAADAWYRHLWDHAAAHFLDPVQGSWHHELDAELEVATGTWSGKPDLYHAVQATLLPRLAPAPALAAQLRDR